LVDRLISIEKLAFAAKRTAKKMKWRRVQSAANGSLRSIPVTRKIQGKFLDFDPVGSKGNASIPLYEGHLLATLAINLAGKKRGSMALHSLIQA
jgi:hypothetical protein